MHPTGDASRREFRAAWAGAAAFGALLSVGTTGVVLWARACLENPPLLVAFSPLVMTAAVFAPFLLPERWQESAPRFVYPLLTLVVLLSPMLVVVTGRALGLLYPILALAGLVRGAPWLREGGWRGLAWRATAALVLAPYLLTEILRKPYAHIFLPEFALLGPSFLVQDTILHTSLAHMIQSLGRASRGLDGLVPLPYHVGSHAWLGFIGRITGSTPFFVFPFIQTALSVPALVTSALLATACFARRGERPLVHASAALMLVLFFDAIGWTSYYISESQTLGLVVTLLGLPLLVDVAEVPDRPPAADRLRLLAAVVLVFTTMAVKFSAGGLLGAGFGWAVLRRPGPRRIAFLGALAAAGLVAIHCFQPRTGLRLTQAIEPFPFLRGLGAERWRASSTLVLPVLYLGGLLVRRRRERFTEVLLVMAALGFAPGLLIRVWGSTAWWFWNTVYWIVLPLAAATALPPGRLRHVVARALPVGVVVLALVRFDVHPFVRLLAPLAPPPPGTSVTRFVWDWLADCRRFAGPIADRLAAGEGTRLLAAVRAVEPDDPRGVAIFIPPSNREYWKMDEPWACRRRPSFVPALTGLPLLKGVGPYYCPLWVFSPHNGYSEYDYSSLTTESDDGELCQHARAQGVTTVIVLESIDEQAKNRVLRCVADGAPS